MSDDTPSRDAVQALLGKYDTLLSLATQRQAAIASGDDRFDEDTARERRTAFRNLAKAFPGALRELDAVDVGTLEHRRLALAAWLGRPSDAAGPLPDWARAALLFHPLLARRLHARAPAASTSRPGDPDARASPTAGTRHLDSVWEAVGRSLGCTAFEAEQLLYPRAPTRGTRRPASSD